MIKVGICVAYDWYLLKHSLPLIYSYADKICLSIDRDRKSWSGKSFAFDESSFTSLVTELDTQNKIQLYEDDFHVGSLSAMQNEVRQRNLMAKQLGEGGWHIQLDCDEYFVGFARFVNYLKTLSIKDARYNVCCLWVTLFKKVDGGFLYVLPSSPKQFEFIQIATQHPHYEYGRRNGLFNVYTNFLIVHQSWARSESEIEQKITNWGHVDDFDREGFNAVWKNLDHRNYMQLRNFHPIVPEVWAELKFQRASGVGELMASFKESDFPSLTPWQLRMRNSKVMAKLRAVWKKLVAG